MGWSISARGVGKKIHSHVLVETAGFRISPIHPFIGASPDAYFLQLLWFSVIEIKCSFCTKDLSVNEAANSCKLLPWKRWAGNHQTKAGPCILLSSTNAAVCYWQTILWFYPLDWKRKYFTFCGTCDTRCGIFWEIIGMCLRLFFKCIFPELLAKPAAAFVNHGQQWCYCREPEVGNMLVCTSGFCSVKKFHLTCLHMKIIPEQWTCPICRKVISSQKKKTPQTKQWWGDVKRS